MKSKSFHLRDIIELRGNFSSKKTAFDCRYLNERLDDKDLLNDLLEICANAAFKVGKITMPKIVERKPPAPFITSYLNKKLHKI